MSFTETVAAGRAFARNDEPAPRADRELLATGLANIGGALFGAMPGGGGTTQTAVNVRAGARTQLAEMVTAAMTLVTIFFLAPLVAMMPQSALAALVIVYSFGLIKPIEFRDILRIRRTEFSWAIVAFAGRRARRHPKGNHRRHNRFPRHTGIPGSRSSSVCPAAQARNQRIPAAIAGTSRGREFSWPLAAQAGRSNFLCQCGTDRTQD